MSQLTQPINNSVGKPTKTNKLTWPDFVQKVLQVTISAYQAMAQDKIAQLSWEEDTFTICLGEDYIRPFVFDNNLPIRVIIRPKVHTDEMKKGLQSAKQAKEIDLQLFDILERDHHRKHFVWEAKRVGDKRINQAYSPLNSEYVNEAIYRFIKKDYADGLKDAGLLAYVLAGKPNTIVTDINKTMGNLRRNKPLSSSNHLHQTKPINHFKNTYQSQHTRIDDSTIQLHHLFFNFAY